jgi:hypothetical protein
MKALNQEQAIALALALAQRWCNAEMKGRTQIANLADEGDCIGYRAKWTSCYFDFCAHYSDDRDYATATFTVVRQSDRIGDPTAAWAVVEQCDCEVFLHVDADTCFPVL